MKIRRTKHLRRYLERRSLSPEAFARECAVSNMTVRRMLRREENEAISPKYWPLFDRATGEATEESRKATSSAELGAFFSATSFEDFGDLRKDLERAGRGEHDLDELSAEAQRKFRATGVGANLKRQALVVLNAIRDSGLSPRARCLAIGALLYFFNPFDLIPDALPGVGYVDDFAILSFVAASILTEKKVSPQSSKEKLEPNPKTRNRRS